MNNYERLINQYKGKVLKVGELSIHELFENWVNKDFVKAININDYNYEVKRAATIEILSSDKFSLCGFAEDNLEFLMFIVKNEGSGKQYYELSMSRRNEFEDVYAVLEIKSGHISSNCSKLFLDLIIDKGIDKKSYDEENIKLIEYLSRIESLEKKWY